ncbi:phage major capsid protein [Microbacterium sp. UBA837]|uniref:phage major capsid protein n=1 Tax=Microbacterium sp. UBA837 TaxID=1946956 RepID=UPI0025E0FCDF|nr:phage major capsid protein [Microbacterium sp. UBA837]|tara:strand:+ start:334 stop:1554 length:1221 start_codon:yes stop_codon:yes gene_type:complete
MSTIAEDIKRLADEQKRAWENEGKPLADIASERAFTAEEQQKFETLERAYNDFDDRINALVMQRNLEERAMDFAGELLGNRSAFGNAADLKKFADDLRSVLGGEQRNLDYVPTSDEVRALSVGTATAGGNTVGATFLQQLVEPLRQFSAVFAAGAYMFVTEKGDEVTLPRLASFGAAAAQTEATQLTGTDPTFNQVKFGAFKYGDYRGISNELITDSLIDIEGLISRLIGENISVLLGQKFAVGAGTTEPTGVVTAATVGKTGGVGVGGVPTWEDLIDLQESVLAPYQARASWIGSNSAIAAIRKLKDTNGRYYWEPNGQTGAPSQLLGNPVYRDPFFATVANGAKSLAYGDFSRYWVRMVGNVRVERSDHALFGSDQVAFRGVVRADGNLVDTSAVKVFQGGAAS